MVRWGTLCAVNNTGSSEPCCSQAAFQPVRKLIGKSLDQKWMVMPLFHEIDGEGRIRAEQNFLCRGRRWCGNCAAPGR